MQMPRAQNCLQFVSQMDSIAVTLQLPFAGISVYPWGSKHYWTRNSNPEKSEAGFEKVREEDKSMRTY